MDVWFLLAKAALSQLGALLCVGISVRMFVVVVVFCSGFAVVLQGLEGKTFVFVCCRVLAFLQDVGCSLLIRRLISRFMGSFEETLKPPDKVCFFLLLWVYFF